MYTNTYCLVETITNRKETLLSSLLCINMNDKGSNVVLSCSDKTKDYIKSMPFNYRIKIEFIENNKIDNIAYEIETIIKTMYYTLEKYGRFIYFSQFMYLIRKVIIPEEIEKQGFGILKKIFNSHNKENDKKRYTMELMYCSKKSVLDDIKSYFNVDSVMKAKEEYAKDIESLQDAEDAEDAKKLKEETIKNLESKKTLDKLMFDIHNKFVYFGYNFSHEHGYTNYFSDGYVISSYDYVGYENQIDTKDISDDLHFKDKPITFVNIVFCSSHPVMKNINRELINKMLNYKGPFYAIYNLEKYKYILFEMPYKYNLGIWDRSKNNINFYNIYELLSDFYPELCRCTVTKSEYFSVCYMMLLDFPSKEWITPNAKNYTKIFYTNHDSSLLESIKTLKKKQFLFYLPDEPKKANEFYLKNCKKYFAKERETRHAKLSRSGTGKSYIFNHRNVRSYDVLLKKLANTDIVEIEDMDLGLLITIMACGAVPVIRKCQERMPTLVEGKHYYVKGIPGYVDIKEAKKNVVKYYKNKCELKKCLKKLINHIFVWDV
jgi:hypothetical protein